MLVNTARLLAAGLDRAPAVETGLLATLSASSAVELGARELLHALGADITTTPLREGEAP